MSDIDRLTMEWIADSGTPMLATTKQAMARFDAWLVGRAGFSSGLSARQFAWVLKRCAYKYVGRPHKYWVLKVEPPEV